MEVVKSLIPGDLRRMIAESSPENLEATCSSLLDFLNALPQFQQVLSDLTHPATALCRKSAEAALDWKRRGNECFLKGDSDKALSFYSQALRHAPMKQEDMDVNLVATLFVNRASALHRMGLLEECLRDCDRAIALSPCYAKAWYRRGKINSALNNYQVAVYDLEVSLKMERSPSGKKHIKEDIGFLKTHLSNAVGMINSCFTGESRESDVLGAKARFVGSIGTNMFGQMEKRHPQQPEIILECVSSPSKGRGIASPKDIPPSSLVHSEEPLTAMVNKSCRETHCHFCFNKLPADVLFCTSCTLPIYCSQYCQELAAGKQLMKNQNVDFVQKCLSAEHGDHALKITLSNHKEIAATDLENKHIPEHRHECGGAHWSAVLPTDVVLAGRVMMKSIGSRKFTGEFSKTRDILDFAHNYSKISLDSKLELHIYAVVLSYCLGRHCSSGFPVTGPSVSQLVLLMSKVKINSMAVVHMKSPDGYGLLKKPGRLSEGNDAFTTCTVEQVRVGQAIYSTGSLFNHSCQPNVHSYFISRTLFLRSTELVPAWRPLELSYGPQVGQLGLQDRQESLKEQYSFTCHCTSCSELNLPDLVINAFRCITPDCLGAVSEMIQYEKLEENFVQVSGVSCSCKLSLPISKEKDIGEVATMLLQKGGVMCRFPPGHCLSCGSYRDLKPLYTACKSAMMDIERLNDSASDIVPDILVSDALEALVQLRSVRHPYSRTVAQAEDCIAEAFVRIGKFDRAMQHCLASIEVVDKLYHSKHIVIGHELMKLTSIQLSLGDFASALCNIKRLEDIFILHYGSDVARIFPYISDLRREADKLASGVEAPH